MLPNSTPSSSLLLASLQRRLPKQTFETWFRPLVIRSSNSERLLTFSAPNNVVREWVTAHYADLIRESLCELSLEQYKIEWLTPQPGREAVGADINRVSTRDSDQRESQTNTEEDSVKYFEAAPST